MSNEMAPKSLKHKDDRHVQTRLDYMLLYRSEGKAKIIRTLESWTDTKYAEWYKGIADSKEQGSEPPVEDLWVTMSYDQFSLFVYGTIRHDTIKQQVDELVALKHIQRRVNPEYPYGPPQYLLNRELVQKSLDELEIPANLFDLAPILTSPRKKHTPQEKYPQGGGKKPRGDQGKIPPGTGETSHPSNNLSKNTNNQAKNESTYPAGESQSDDPGSSEPTHAPVIEMSPVRQQHQELREQIGEVVDALSQDSYSQATPTATLSQDVGSDDYVKGHTDETTTAHPGTTGATQRLRVAAGVGHSNAAANERDVRASQQSALLAPSAAPARARVETRRTGQGKAAEKQKYAVYFTLEGSQFREWEETITGIKLDETAANARACNTLGTKSGMTYANLEEVHKAISANKWVKERDVVVTVQDLASPDGVLRWEKWLPVALRNLQKQASKDKPQTPPSDNHCLYSDEELDRQSDQEWARIQAQLANPEVQAKLAAKGITL